MLDIGWSEMAIVMVVALLVIGPKDLPRVARSVGKWAAKARSMAREFQRSLDDMAREAELSDIKSELDKVRHKNIGQTIRDAVDPQGELDKAFDVGPDRPERQVTSGPAAVERATEEGMAPRGEQASPDAETSDTATASPREPAPSGSREPAATGSVPPRPQDAAAAPQPEPVAGAAVTADDDAARKS